MSPRGGGAPIAGGARATLLLLLPHATRKLRACGGGAAGAAPPPFPVVFIVVFRCCCCRRLGLAHTNTERKQLILIPFASSPVIITRRVKPRAKHQHECPHAHSHRASASASAVQGRRTTSCVCVFVCGACTHAELQAQQPFFRGHLLRMKGNGGNKWSAQCRRVTEIWGFHCHHGRIMVMDGLFPLTSIGGALGNAAGPGGAECSEGHNGRCTLLLPASAETSNFLHGRSNFSSFFGRIYIASSSTIFTSLGGIWNLDSDSYYAPEARLIDAFYLCR
jgi:hypothetical protein